MGPCRACAVSSTVSLCGKSAEATTKPITETRETKSNKHLPLYIPTTAPHSPPQAALLAWALPHPLHGAGIRGSGNQICYWRERRSSLKENSGVHNPSLHLAQLRWRGGGTGGERRSKQRAYPPPTRGDEREEKGGMEVAHNGCLCVWGGDGLQRQPWGGRRAPLCPPHSSPHIQREERRGSERGSGHRLVRACPLFQGRCKKRTHTWRGGGGGGVGSEATPKLGGGEEMEDTRCQRQAEQK